MEWHRCPSPGPPYPAGFSQHSEWTPWDRILIGYSGCSWWVGSLFSSGGCFCQKSKWTCSSSETSRKRMSKCIFSFSSHSSSFAKAGLRDMKSHIQVTGVDGKLQTVQKKKILKYQHTWTRFLLLPNLKKNPTCSTHIFPLLFLFIYLDRFLNTSWIVSWQRGAMKCLKCFTKCVSEPRTIESQDFSRVYRTSIQ